MLDWWLIERWLTDWSIDWAIARLIDWFTHWWLIDLIDWLIDWLNDGSMVDWLVLEWSMIDWLTDDWLTDAWLMIDWSMIDWLIDRLNDCSLDRLIYWSIDWLIDWLIDWWLRVIRDCLHFFTSSNLFLYIAAFSLVLVKIVQPRALTNDSPVLVNAPFLVFFVQTAARFVLNPDKPL